MRALIWLLAVLVTAAATHVAIVYASPRLIMRKAMEGMIARAKGTNAPSSTPPATARSRAIVKPSPDLAYTACVYDISAGPVLVAGSPSQAYWSIGLYGDNSDNFHVVTSSQAVNGTAAIILAKPGQTTPAAQRTTQTLAPPSDRGIVLFRYLVLDAAALIDAKRAQATAVCTALKEMP